ncbi:MAG: lytic transglycosylase domain-containing protein, partial [Burkholderiales bacterium]
MELASNMVAGGAAMRIPGLSGVVRLLSLARGVFALIGLSAVLVVAVPASRGVLIQQADAIARANQSVAESVTLAAGTIKIGALPAQSKQEQEAVTAFIAKRYRVADEAVAGFVSAAYRAGRQFAVDPLLILAVMAVESRYNPVAESGVGAKGLMQVLPRFHLDKLEAHGGEEALLDPDVNIEIGTQILREYLRRFGVTVTALQQYAG